MKNFSSTKMVDECGTLFPLNGNTVLYQLQVRNFLIIQGKGQDKRIGLKKTLRKV